MRWRLGRSSAKKKAATSHGVVDVSPTTAASGTDWQRSGTSSEVHETSTTGDDGENFYYATASGLTLRRRSANSARANGARLRINDDLTSSFVSFVEGYGSQPRRQSSSAGDDHRSPSSAGLDGGSRNGNGASMSCRGGADNALLCTIGGSGDESGDGSGDSSSKTAAATTTGTAMSSFASTGRANVTQEDLLIAEVHGYVLRRGGVDNETAAMVARMCLSLILSLEPTLEAIQDTRPADLVSLAREHLDLSPGASTYLLDHLVDNWATVARLITAGTDLDDSHLRYPSSSDGPSTTQIDDTAAKGSENTSPDYLFRHIGAQTGDRVTSGTETLAASGAGTAEAAAMLYEACRTWREIIKAVGNTTGAITSAGHRDEAGRTRATATRVPSDGAEEREDSGPPDATWFCSLESPRGQCRPHLGRSNERSTPATVPTEGTGESREEGQQDRIRYNKIRPQLSVAGFFRVSEVVGLADVSPDECVLPTVLGPLLPKATVKPK